MSHSKVSMKKITDILNTPKNICFVFCRSTNGLNNSNSRAGLDHLPITGGEWNNPKHYKASKQDFVQYI